MSSVSSPELLNPATTTIMLSVSLSPAFTVLAGVALIFVAACAFAPARLLRWFQRKRYQYEVTFSLYMLTPTEKFVFNSILFLFLSMVSIAVALYLPRHVKIIAQRAYYLVTGDLDTTTRVADALSQTSAAAVTASTQAAAVVPEL